MTAPESPAAVLRRAAALMRERAGAATPGPWEHPLDYDVTHGYRREGSVHVATWIASCDAGDGDISDEQAMANADHIASWHPGVALAVADWLDTVITTTERFPVTGSGTIHAALRIARAYLGEKVPDGLELNPRGGNGPGNSGGPAS